MNAKIIAFYLPQYHPIPENNKWYGKGFTEWTSVARAKPLFRNHHQPNIPADLGFYDLRLKETREAQAILAESYGIDAFCYWHYWFGNDKRLLEMPFESVVKDKNINLPFCLGWANHSWEKKLWDVTKKNELIVAQEYNGVSDYENHFYSMIYAFKDKRYLRVNGKLFFVIFKPLASKEITVFISRWQELAKQNGLTGFYFVGCDTGSRNKDEILRRGFNAIYNDNTLMIHHHLTIFDKISKYILRKYFGHPTKFKYAQAIKYFLSPDSNSDTTIPCVAPNWDHSPRSGKNSMILTGSTPKLFGKIFKEALETVQNKNPENRLVLIKSWNEWGEGNYLEPDNRFGKQYLEEVKKVKQSMNMKLK